MIQSINQSINQQNNHEFLLSVCNIQPNYFNCSNRCYKRLGRTDREGWSFITWCWADLAGGTAGLRNSAVTWLAKLSDVCPSTCCCCKELVPAFVTPFSRGSDLGDWMTFGLGGRFMCRGLLELLFDPFETFVFLCFRASSAFANLTRAFKAPPSSKTSSHLSSSRFRFFLKNIKFHIFELWYIFY